VSEPSDKTLIDSILSLFKPFEIAGGVGAFVTIILWIIGLPSPVLLVGGAVSLTLFSVGIVGHVKRDRERGLQTLGRLSEITRRRKLRPQSNLRLVHIEHQKLYLDDRDTYWEVQHNPKGSDPNYCALLRFSNDARSGQPGQPIKRLRARLVFRNPESGFEYAPIDRGAWVREEYNTFTLEVGNSRLLVIARGFPPNVPRVPNIDTPWWVFIPINNHYSSDNYGKMFFQRMRDKNLEVDVQILAGDGGYVIYEGMFNLQTNPHLILTAREGVRP